MVVKRKVTPRKAQKKEPDKLDKKRIAKFKKFLLKEREQIAGEVKQIVESSKEMGQDGIQLSWAVFKFFINFIL